jgi:hypothetical protein
MCNPLAIGLMVAGTALQVNAQHRRANAMQGAAKEARMLEDTRQAGLSKEREAALLASQANLGVEAQTQLQKDAAAKREAAYDAAPNLSAAATGTDYTPAENAGQPRIIQEDVAKKRAEANEGVRQVGNARARLGAYGDVGLGNRLVNANAGQQIGMLGGFARQSAALLPGEVQSAMRSKEGVGANQEMLGTALQLYGSAGAPTMFGGTAAATAAGAGANAATNAAVTGAADAGAAFAPGAASQALMADSASTLFPTVAGSAAPTAGLFAAPAYSPSWTNRLGGFFGNGAPLFGTATTKGYLPGRSSFAALRG